MRHRLAVAVIAVAVVLSSVPLYRSVKQEFIPTNVDEAEFEGQCKRAGRYKPRCDERNDHRDGEGHVCDTGCSSLFCRR
jgi:hypothetical protein